MIPQAIKGTGPYADLWNQLKSMMHALSRVEKARSVSDIAPLDKSRLQALVSFITQELKPRLFGVDHFHRKLSCLQGF